MAALSGFVRFRPLSTNFSGHFPSMKREPLLLFPFTSNCTSSRKLSSINTRTCAPERFAFTLSLRLLATSISTASSFQTTVILPSGRLLVGISSTMETCFTAGLDVSVVEEDKSVGVLLVFPLHELASKLMQQARKTLSMKQFFFIFKLLV